jgi:flavin reductase (DIM6/NTAB) family NADH-FMN oxidoreductase RutF
MKFDLTDLDYNTIQAFLFAAISPRPICLVSTVSENGVFNVAPLASYGRLSTKPTILYIAVGVNRKTSQRKDTIKNIEHTGDFVINAVDEPLAMPMIQASAAYPSDVDEFKEAGLTPVKSDLVRAPRVAESPISMECKLTQVLKLGEFPDSVDVVLGETLRVHVHNDLWADGKIQTSKYQPIGRIGDDSYCRMTDTFEMRTPDV